MKKNSLTMPKRLFSLIVCLLIAVTMTPVATVALEPVDVTQPGSLKLIYKDTEKNISLSNVRFNVYRVADDTTGYENYKPNDLFSGAAVSFDNLDAEGWRGAAGQLDGYVKLNQIQPDASMTTDENGECSLSSLHPGLFLVVGDVKIVEETANDLKYTPQSTLVSVPSCTDEVTKADWNYDVVTSVQFNREEVDKPTVSRRVVKVWEDKDGNAMAAPEGASITVQLLSNDRPSGDPVVLNADNNWTYTWTDLPALTKYTLAEVSVPENYVASVAEDDTNFIVTNRFTNELIGIISGEKKWDASIKDRPEFIKVKLLANGKETGDVVEVRPNENNLWLWSFKDKLKYDENGEEIDYSVAEEADGAYIPKVETMMGNPYNMTMTNLPSSDSKRMNLNVYKKWVGSDKGPDTIKVRLHSSASDAEDQIVELKSPEWQYTFEDLDVEDAYGRDITYTITEEAAIDGYTTTYSSGSPDTTSVSDKEMENIVKNNTTTIINAVRTAMNVTITVDQAKRLLNWLLSYDLSKVTAAQVRAAAATQGVTLSNEQVTILLTALKSIDTSVLKKAQESTANPAVKIYADKAMVDTSRIDMSKPVEILITNTADQPADPVHPVQTGFIDVPDDAYYAPAVSWAVKASVTRGTSSVTFSPDVECSRAEMVTFLWRAVGCPEPKIAINPFQDVGDYTFYTKAVLWAVEQGITNGTSSTTFSPSGTVTRGQTVTFLWRMEGKENINAINPFSDVPYDTYYTKAVLWAVKNRVTNGTSAVTFSPESPCTRAHIVTFLYRDLIR